MNLGQLSPQILSSLVSSGRVKPETVSPYTDMQQAQDLGQEAINERYKLEQTKLAAQQEEQNKYQQSIQPLIEQEKVSQDMYAKQMADAKASLSRIDDELAKTKVDPERLTSGWRGVLATVAQAVGAFTSIASKTPNYAQQIISDAIDRDVKSQMLDLQQKERAAQRERAVIGDIQNTREGQLKQEQLARIRATEQYKAALDRVGMQMQGSEAGVKALDASAKLAAESAKLRQSYLDNAQNIAIQQGNLKMAQERLAFQREVDARERTIKEGEREIPSLKLTGEKIPTANDTKEATDILSDTRHMLQTLNEIYGDIGITIPGTEYSQELITKIRMVYSTMAKLNNMGVMNPADIEYINTYIPSDPGKLNVATTKAAIKTATGVIYNKFKNKIAAHGYTDNGKLESLVVGGNNNSFGFTPVGK